MTLQDLGNIGDFIGGIAVIATLLYLAVQVRQNTRILRTSAEQGSNPVAAMSILAQSPENAAVYHRGLVDLQALSPEERTHFFVLMATNFYSIHQAYRSFLLGTQSEDTWNHWQLYALRFFAGQPGVRAWWRQQGSSLFDDESSFRHLVGEEMKKHEAQEG